MPSNLLTPLAPCALIVLLTLPACHAQQARPQQARPEERDNSSRQENNSQPEIQHTNRLAEESSPYLLQHAHNPVDWYPWGEEAMRKAAQENKLIFLSVGYAACHWCHVMERESFTDEEIAAFMNEHFVCVKVDREERPDVDQIYMTSVQLISGQGGWPMSVFILPDGRPFWGGTYFPPRDGERGVSTGFLSILKQINQVWETQRDQVLQQADTLTEAIKATQPPQPEEIEGDLLSPEWVASTMQALQQQFDSTYGGFGTGLNQPKFPEPSNLVFLLQRAADSGLPEEQRQRAASMLVKSLDGMISGAMYDHLGGGFHRYSVDGGWQIPHFEKMLYDNAQLASVYVRAFEQTQRQEYRAIAEGICDFTIRQLQAESGGFYCALDADSEGEEGKFYRWTAQELDSLSEKPGIALAREVYRLKGKPNFEQHYYVPSPGDTLTDVARSRGETFSSLQERLAEPRATMLEVRSRREPPRTDVKILTAWNGLMIAALADVGRMLQRDDYLEAAMNAAEFVERELRDSDGRLKRSYAAGEARLNGYVDDYAFYASGLLALHRATGEPRWFKLAQEVTRKQIDLFWDSQAGGFFFTSHDHPRLVVRVKDPVDGAVPAGSSVTLENLSTLAKASRDDSYDEIRERTLKSLVPLWRRAANAAPRAAAQLHVYLEETRQP